MRENHRNRTYHSKLITIFAVIAVIISITVIAAVFLVESNLRASVIHTKESLEEVSSHVAESSIREASGAIDELSASEAVTSWVSAGLNSADYYFGALQIYKELRRLSPVDGMYSYEISITSANPEAFVITQDGTRSRRSFLDSLDVAGLSAGGIEPGTYRTADGSRFIMVLNRSRGNGTAVIIAEFPASLMLVPDESGIDVAVIDEFRNSIVSEDGAWEINDVPIENIPEGLSERGGYAYRKVSFPYFRCSIVYSHYAGFMAPVIVFAVFIPFVIIAAVLIAYTLQKNLYAPIKTAYESVRDDEDGDAGNEFDAIISRCREVDSLSRRLNEMIEELHMATDMQKYRSYIFGSDSHLRAPDDESASFAVAIIVDDEDVSELSVSHLLQIYSRTSDIRHLHFIFMDDGTGTVIYKADDEDECYSFLYRCLREYTAIDEASTIQAFIAPPSTGWRSIRPSYQKAKEIMGFRYLMRDKAILTNGDISWHGDTMSYSVSDERKLINAALAASPDTIAVFDDIVRENSEKIMPESERRKLVAALSSTVMRIFQETKEGESASSQLDSLMDAGGSEMMLARLREVLAGYIERKRSEDETKYSSTVALMKEYIQKHYSEPIMLIDLSEEFNLSPKYCSEIFNRLSGDTFKNYLNRFRIDAAQHIIDDDPDIRIADLAVRVGFSSSNTFIRVFDKYMGVTPKQYAENVKKGIMP